MKAIHLLSLAVLGLALGASACSKDSAAATRTTNAVSAAPAEGACAHASCADSFFIDALPDPACAAGAVCTVTLRLVASGDFHINDEYPYRFRGDDAPGVEYLGTDGGGKNVFSKAAGDWQKVDLKNGAMTLKFKPDAKGTKTVTGTLKLSVCSEQNCLLEQRHVSASVTVS